MRCLCLVVWGAACLIASPNLSTDTLPRVPQKPITPLSEAHMSSLTRKSLVHGSHYSLFNFSFLYFWKVNDLCVNVCWINKCWLQFVALDSVQYKVPFPVVLNSTVVVLFSTVVGLKIADLCSLCNYCWDSRFHKATNHDVLTLYGSYAPERSTSLCRRGLCDSTCVIHTFHTFRQEPSMSATYSRTWLKAVEVILRSPVVIRLFVLITSCLGN